MCGICGMVNYRDGERLDRRLTLAMCAAMRHRGPDGVGYFDRPEVQFGHVRLSIIDLGGGAQPMSNEDGTVHVVFNGEIYNYPQLRPQLLARGHALKTHCDTEVLVHLYEDHGANLVDHLLGDFAFALWDEKRKYLLLARDRLGVKPVYYVDMGGRLAFASEMCALAALPDLPREIDASAVSTYLAIHRIPAPRTIYRDVRKLLPGHRLEIENGRVRVSRYWDVRMAPDEGRSEAQYAEELRALMDDAVRGQLMSDVPLGVFLSGGVDSSAVTTSMVAQSAGTVRTFSIGFKEARYDESRYYKMLAARLGVEHHEFIFEPDLMDILPKLAYHFGEPCAIGSAIPLYYLSRLAREFVTVALSGDGGDEVWAGYNVYNFANWVRLVDRAAGPIVASRWAGALLDRVQGPTTSRVGNFFRRLRKIRRLVMSPPSERVGLIGSLPDFGDALLTQDAAGAALIPEYVEAFQRADDGRDWLAPYLYADIKTLLPDEMFTKLDRMTMANRMEGRVPLVDYRLVELAARTPSRFKLKKGEVKAIFKRAVRDRLPEEVLNRPKVGFRVPLDEWFRGPLRSMAGDLLTGASFRQSGLFRVEAVDRLFDHHIRATGNHGSDILALVMFELWRRGLHQGAAVPTGVSA